MRPEDLLKAIAEAQRHHDLTARLARKRDTLPLWSFRRAWLTSRVDYRLRRSEAMLERLEDEALKTMRVQVNLSVDAERAVASLQRARAAAERLS